MRYQHPTPNVQPRREAVLTLLAVALTLFFLAMVTRHLWHVGADEWSSHEIASRVVFLTFVGVIVSLLYGVLVFFLSRLGYYVRLGSFDPARFRPHLATPEPGPRSPLVILVPSYKEDAITIQQTLLSAALQDYPDRRVVLLLDDPPRPSHPDDQVLLDTARAMPAAIRTLLNDPLREARIAADTFAARSAEGFAPRLELELLADAFGAASRWFGDQAAEPAPDDHVDVLFRSLVFDTHRMSLDAAIRDLRDQRRHGSISVQDVANLYQRLVQQFDVEITVFERKHYANLSQEMNKAANLNSYIGLLGRTVHQVHVAGNVHLADCDAGDPGGLHVRRADYVVTLDADSLLSPDYARRLISVMESPGNERIAVVQTPYSAIPGARSVIERVAGATTDIQYLIHQGFTWMGATFWVGANALLRMSALDDIRRVEVERGHEVSKFIQDRTVIEDTESSIDLVARGWRLHNEPLRLAYSATPADFGALLIQRRRWATGGLLILPKLVRYALGRQWHRIGFVEMLIRVHYLASPALAGVGPLLLLVLPVGESYLSPWMALMGLPYFLLYWRDMIHAGYPKLDLLRVYAFNWLLMPINIAGAVQSVQQGVTGEKIPFGRTPKVTGRTAAPAWAIAALWVLLLYTMAGAVWNAELERWYHASFSAMTCLALGYAMVVLVGVRQGLEDLRPLREGALRATTSILLPGRKARA